MCQKQCRDENGFKVSRRPTHSAMVVPCPARHPAHCLALQPRTLMDGEAAFDFRPRAPWRAARMQCHCESESHMRQMLLFANDSGTYIDAFSEEFEFVRRARPPCPRCSPSSSPQGRLITEVIKSVCRLSS